MIKNLVFDFGNVLIRYEPEYIVSQYVTDPEDRRLITDVLFDRLYWDPLDDGSITDEEVVRYSCARLPERLHSVAGEIYYNWGKHLPEMPGMWDLVRRVKQEYGVRVYLLSNIGSLFARFEHLYPIFDEMEDRIFSALVGHVKPNKDMFEYLCTRTGILPEETLFIDDAKRNIDGAEAFGIKGYLFDGDVHKLSSYFDGLLSKNER
jgi:putative hydrolase of the HAD superfamily